MLDRYEIKNIEQLRAISDLLRIRIIDFLQRQPMTVTQLSERLNATSNKEERYAPAKIHYHVRELEKVGLLRLVETREKGGILEKYYQPIAKDIIISHKLFFRGSSDEVFEATTALFGQLKDGFYSALRDAIAEKIEQPTMTFTFNHLYIIPEEMAQISQQIANLLEPYEHRRNREGEQEVLSAFLAYPLTDKQLLEAPVQGKETHKFTPGAINTENTFTEKTWTIGYAIFNRAGLEKIVDQGRRLDLTVIGICQIAKDVSPDLAEQAIEKLSLIGKLEAPKAVYEVLIKKRA